MSVTLIVTLTPVVHHVACVTVMGRPKLHTSVKVIRLVNERVH